MLYVGSWYFLVMKEFLKKLIVGVLLIICIGLNFEKSNIIADEWSESVKFYNSYGNSAVFKATNIYEGDIYFCSAGNTSTSGTKYRTIGYKMSVKNSSGNVIQTIYYQMGGSYMTLKCQAKSGGKEYMMYQIPLRYVKNRMNQESLNALSSKAANWTDSALSALYSYYGKTVRGLFHTIDVRKSTGISSVSGGGTYCYGTYVTISASSSAGYDFTNWNNDSAMSSSSYGFYVNSGGTYTAYAKAGTIWLGK